MPQAESQTQRGAYQLFAFVQPAEELWQVPKVPLGVQFQQLTGFHLLSECACRFDQQPVRRDQRVRHIEQGSSGLVTRLPHHPFDRNAGIDN